MARRGSVIAKAVVEQEIHFDSEYYFEDFIRKLDYYEEPYKIVSKTYSQGSLVVVIRKRYGEYPFLGDTDLSTLSDFWKEIRDAERGATRDDDGCLNITDVEKYRRWQAKSCDRSRY